MAIRFKPPVMFISEQSVLSLTVGGDKTPKINPASPTAAVAWGDWRGFGLAGVTTISCLALDWSFLLSQRSSCLPGEFRLSQVCGQTNLVVTEIIYFLLLSLSGLLLCCFGAGGMVQVATSTALWCLCILWELRTLVRDSRTSLPGNSVPLYWTVALELPAEGIIYSIYICNLRISSELFISWEGKLSCDPQTQAGFAGHSVPWRNSWGCSCQSCWAAPMLWELSADTCGQNSLDIQ